LIGAAQPTLHVIRWCLRHRELAKAEGGEIGRGQGELEIDAGERQRLIDAAIDGQFGIAQAELEPDRVRLVRRVEPVERRAVERQPHRFVRQLPLAGQVDAVLDGCGTDQRRQGRGEVEVAG
jgi:hypothetical protein